MTAGGHSGPLGGPADAPSARAGRCDGATPDPAAVVRACADETEALFVSGTHHCAEAVVSVIREHFRPDVPEEVVRLVSGLGAGCNVGCICGAISGAAIALGMVLGDDKEAVEEGTRAVHAWFKETYRTACCRALQRRDGGGCRVHPGEVAGKVAELLLRREQGTGP